MENSEIITNAVAYIKSQTIRAQSAGDITIDDVARHAGFSTDYFNRIFLAHTGFNVMEYVRFCRLKNAARLLRMGNERDILSIALECGYEAQESFSRAFKNQYGLTPGEYRKKYAAVEPCYAEFYTDSTLGSRLVHEFGDFKIAETDDVIDFVLEYDALRYGYSAVCWQNSGGVALYKGEDFRDGFIWFSEWDGTFEGEIICDDWEKIAEYKRTFSDSRFTLVIHTTLSNEEIKAQLAKYGVELGSVKRRQLNVYTGEMYSGFEVTGFSMRLLTYDDYDLIVGLFKEKWPDRWDIPRLKHLEHELYQRDVVGCDEHSVFMFGVFEGNRLIGISDGALQRAHGLLINNCVVTMLLREYDREELYRYAFRFVTNAALERGALPFDDVQTPSTAPSSRSGEFNSTELGYRCVTEVCVLG